MKKNILTFFLIAFCVFTVNAKSKTLDSSLSEASKSFAEKLDSTSKTVAIVDLTSGYDTLDEYLMETMKHNMSIHLKKAVLVERNEHVLELIKNENIYQESGAVRDDTIQDIGSALGADCLIFGSVKTVSGGYQIYLQAVDIVGKKVLVSYKNKLEKNEKEIAFHIQKGGKIKKFVDPLSTLKQSFNQIETVATMYNTKLSYDDIEERLVNELSYAKWNKYMKKSKYGKYFSSNSFLTVLQFHDTSVEYAWGVYKYQDKDGTYIFLTINDFIFVFNCPKDNIDDNQFFGADSFCLSYSHMLAYSANILHEKGFSYNKAELTALNDLMLKISFKFFEVSSPVVEVLETYRNIIDLAYQFCSTPDSPIEATNLVNMAVKTKFESNILYTIFNAVGNGSGTTNYTLSKTLKNLITNGIDVNTPSKMNKAITPLALAIDTYLHETNGENFEIIKLLIEAGADVNARSEGKYSSDDNDAPLIKVLENYDKDNGANFFQLIKLLIDAGADVNVKSDHYGGNYPLNIVLNYYSKSHEQKYDKKDYDKIIPLLLKAGANINAKNDSGYTALMSAVERLDYSTVELLINSRANVNIKDNIGGSNALHYLYLAVLDDNLNSFDIEPILNLLVKAGINLNLKNKYGNTVLSLAEDRAKKSENIEDFVKLLRKAGAK